MRLLRLLTLAATGTMLVAACGGEDTERAPSGLASGEELPACSEVWVEGEELAEDYAGCFDEGTTVIMVTDGEGWIVYGDHLQARPGGVIEVRS